MQRSSDSFALFICEVLFAQSMKMWSFQLSFRNLSCDQVIWSASSKRAHVVMTFERGRKFDALTFGTNFFQTHHIYTSDFELHVVSHWCDCIVWVFVLWIFSSGEYAKVPLVNFAISSCTLLRFACTILHRCVWTLLLSSWCTSLICLSLLENSSIEGSIVCFALWSQRDTLGLRNILNTKHFCLC